MASPAPFPPHLRHLHSPPHRPQNPNHNHLPISRRSLLVLPFSSSLLPLSSAAADSTTAATTPSSSPAVTDRVFMDFSLCPNYLRPDRPIGAGDLSASGACPDAIPIGRVVFGLYGRLLPITTTNFKAACATAAYRGVLVHKLLPGRFFVSGRQGRRRDKGEVLQPPPGLASNVETIDPKAFQLKHTRPGTLSLCLSLNDDDDEIKLNPEYHNMEFLVTTGPGPCPELDDQNMVFGTVLEGMDVVTSIASIPTYKPAERIRQFNDFAEFLGDERAQTARAMWDRPLKTVYISDCGELKVTNPSLSPILP
ncbi:peptidyl-prolyl cis-trans isomerase CYP28, chloroplastic [Typha latifolia]|uniref:peptidyl-prolyl cis-trans isomerase CYP28, chloroplastic n=1 Tax=Typha latifolia TaxID=4733 RepID=UPI003C2D13ED